MCRMEKQRINKARLIKYVGVHQCINDPHGSAHDDRQSEDFMRFFQFLVLPAVDGVPENSCLQGLHYINGEEQTPYRYYITNGV